MAGRIVFPDVGFGFHDDAGGGAFGSTVNEDLPEELARDFERWTAVELSWKLQKP